jgi:hypothetical protein
MKRRDFGERIHLKVWARILDITVVILDKALGCIKLDIQQERKSHLGVGNQFRGITG